MCHPYIESATALSDISSEISIEHPSVGLASLAQLLAISILQQGCIKDYLNVGFVCLSGINLRPHCSFHQTEPGHQSRFRLFHPSELVRGRRISPHQIN